MRRKILRKKKAKTNNKKPKRNTNWKVKKPMNEGGRERRKDSFFAVNNVQTCLSKVAETKWKEEKKNRK